MAPVASQLIREVTAHVQSDSLEDEREICTDLPTTRGYSSKKALKSNVLLTCEALCS